VYKKEEIPRVPIVATGNDFSTLYAPLIRDGRMEKFYWNPTREDRIGICAGIFRTIRSTKTMLRFSWTLFQDSQSTFLDLCGQGSMMT